MSTVKTTLYVVAGLVFCLTRLSMAQGQYPFTPRTYPVFRGAISAPEFVPKVTDAENNIFATLTKPTSVHFEDAPLSKLASDIRESFQTNIVFNETALDEVGLAVESTFSLQLSNVTLANVLSQSLRPLGLDWCIHHGAIVITSKGEAEISLWTRIYEVTDICAQSTDSGRVSYDFDSTIELITATFSPDTWEDVGGQGSIQPIIVNHRAFLVLSQQYRIHLHVEALLSKMRRVAGLANPKADSGRTTPGLPQATARKLRRRLVTQRALAIRPIVHGPLTGNTD